MKKTIVLIFTLVIAISLATPAFAQDDESILIYPWLIVPDENGERIIKVSPNQVILLGARWGACTRGLANAWAQTAYVAYEIDGQPIFTSFDESRQYWSWPPIPLPIQEDIACVNKTDTGWVVYWEYELGNLSIGDHPARFDYWNNLLQIIDGADHDGDGKPDRGGLDWSIDFIIRVAD
jgi:hypothetical protein